MSEAIELHAMGLAPDERGTRTGRDGPPLVPHRVTVILALGGSAARRSLDEAGVRPGLADSAGPVTDAPQPRVGCQDVCERLAPTLAPQRSVDPGHVDEVDRLQVGGMY